MALLGHVTPEMTLRYAGLASETVRATYDAAMAKTRTKQHLMVTGAGGTFMPERVEWLHTEMLKTRVAHGYCSRHPAAGACPYICEQCDNFVTAPEFTRGVSGRPHELAQPPILACLDSRKNHEAPVRGGGSSGPMAGGGGWSRSPLHRDEPKKVAHLPNERRTS